MAAPAPQVASPVWDEARLRDPHGQPDKADRVRSMFNRIAPAYERVNRWSSFGRDAYWRAKAVRLASVTPDDRVLDVACGTGDFARAFLDGGACAAVGADFACDMLTRAAQRGTPRAAWLAADGLRLPVADGAFSIASCAFGVRNFQDLSAGLREMHRVLRPGGRAVILEFSMPRRRWLRAPYALYLNQILPRLASVLSGDRSGAYRYLARSVSSFVDEAGMEAALRDAGFDPVRRHALTFGVVQTYVAHKPVAGPAAGPDAGRPA